jgi:ABC-type nitrate/sulfonate/bicarbonate transport system permease component
MSASREQTGLTEPRPPTASSTQGGGARRGWLYRLSGIWTVRILTFVLAILAWEVYARGVSTALLATPSAIGAATIELFFGDGEFWTAFGQSIAMLGYGLGLSVVVGVPIGIVMGRSRVAEFLLDPYVNFFYVIPIVAFVPLLVLWFGFSSLVTILLVFLAGVFPMIVNSISGVKGVDKQLLDGGVSFCATEFQLLRTIVLPAALPFLLSGLRISFAAAWAGVIVAELLAQVQGLGGMIMAASMRFQTAHMFVPIVAIMAVGVGSQAAIVWLGRKLTPWHESARA